MRNDVEVVIGSWGSYNECNERALGSKWICLNDYKSWEDIEEELKNQGFQLDGIDEELFIQDVMNFPAKGVNWDYVNPQDLFELLQKSGVLTDADKFDKMEAYCEIEGYQSWEDRVESYDDDWDEEIYLYPDFSWEDLGRYFINEVDCLDVPDALENYIDYEAYGEELSYCGFHQYNDGIVEIRS